MISLPWWAFALCVAGPFILAVVAGAAGMLLYIGKGFFL